MYLARDASPRRHTAEYHVQGRRMRVTHGTEDTAVFQEIFTAGFYDFSPDRVPAPRRVADIGGNVGMFALYAAVRWPNAEIVAFEPDPANAAKYRWTMTHNAIRGHLIEACATSRDGAVLFSPGHESMSHITDDGSGVRVPAVDVFPHLADVDLIKIDIEGGEWELLLDERFAGLQARTVLMEYHPYLCPSDDPRALAEARLRTAGYKPEAVFHDASGVGLLRAFR
jgi:FkbM family methyltransferase